jgi:hypothetical protein
MDKAKDLRMLMQGSTEKSSDILEGADVVRIMARVQHRTVSHTMIRYLVAPHQFRLFPQNISESLACGAQ